MIIQIPITTTPANAIVILLGYSIYEQKSIPGQPKTVSTSIHCVNTKVNTRVNCGINNEMYFEKHNVLNHPILTIHELLLL